MPHVLVAGPIHDSGFDLLRDAALTWDYVTSAQSDAMAPFLPEADAVLLRTQPFGQMISAAAPRLRIVSRHGVGFEAVDVDALSARGIPVAIVGDVNAGTVAEHAMLLMLAASRRLLDYDRACRPDGDWSFRNSLEALEVAGKTLLIIGLGRIGRHLARIAQAFGIDVVAYDPYLADEPPAGVAMVHDLDAALVAADLISVHAPKTDAPVLDARRLERLKRNAIVVNTSRGGAIDEDALTAALGSGRIHGAGIDVFEDEPPTPASPLRGQSRAVLTPHAAAMTVECAERMAVAAAKNIVDYFAGRLEPDLVVNAQALGLIDKTGGAATGVGGHQ